MWVNSRGQSWALYCVLLFGYALVAYSQGVLRLSEAGIKNLGSTMAYIGLCENEGHIQDATLATLVKAAQEALSFETWKQVESQYHRSLLEKKHYSVKKNTWYPFNLRSYNCRNLESAAPTMVSALRKGGR